ncbi:molybdenum cofactor guanylyltransferase [Neisseriaceae bacterium TC5R-5]|nr:molybdenum cofactor guanylyltransferase [Neisseriaceae bacterium TC5R-5]
MKYCALILAGGRASRMGGQDKGLIPLAGQPLIAHTLAALAAQTLPPQHIMISANRHLDTYASYGHPVLPDSLPDFAGPLAGLLSGMAQQGERPLLMLPCDAVRLPPDFAARLLAALAQGAQAISTRDPSHWHPSLLAIQPGLQAGLAVYLAAGGRSIRGWLAGIQHEEVSFAESFPNLNTPEALAAFEGR